MSRRERVQETIDAIANALQEAIGRATLVRRPVTETSDETVALEAAIGRAIAVLKRLQPPHRGRQ